MAGSCLLESNIDGLPLAVPIAVALSDLAQRKRAEARFAQRRLRVAAPAFRPSCEVGGRFGAVVAIGYRHT